MRFAYADPPYPRFLPSHKTRAINHVCGNPPTYYVLKYVEALRRWRCTGCGRIVG